MVLEDLDTPVLILDIDAVEDNLVRYQRYYRDHGIALRPHIKTHKTLALASRRAALEKEVARAYANAFSEDELKKITAFYTSPVGKKLLSDGPIVEREVGKAARIWQNGIARDLAQSVGDVLSKAEAKEKNSDDTAPAKQ